MAILRPRWQKILRDFAYNRMRTVLVVTSIGIGVFAFGSIIAGLIVTQQELNNAFLGTNPASATITTTGFDDVLVNSVAKAYHVAQAQGRRAVTARIQLGPAMWQDTVLYLLPNDGNTTVNMVFPEQGAWPPPRHGVLIERASLSKAQAHIGDTVTIEVPGHTAQQVLVAGTAYDMSLPPAVISGQVFGYVDADTMAWLGGPTSYNQVAFVVQGDRYDLANIRAVADTVERLVKRSGRGIINTDIPSPPLQHPAEIILPTLMTILSILGLLVLVISTFLIINTISAILTQQTRQIGVMKAIGARADQISGMYYALAVAFGLLALFFAIPMSMLGSYAFEKFIAGQLNVDIRHFTMPPGVIFLEIVAAVVVPVIASSIPIRAVINRPARESLAGDTSAPVGTSRIDTLIAKIRGVSRPTRLALRNTFRQKSRLARTLAALALGGAVFISAMTLRASLFVTLDASIASQRYDVEVQFNRPYRTSRVTPDILAVPGVVTAESLLRDVIYPVHADGTTGEKITVRAMPAETDMFAPRMVTGRWLQPGERDGIVLSTNIVRKEPSYLVGQVVTIRIADQDYPFTIVGYIEELQPPINPALAYMTIDGYNAVAGGVGRTDTIRVSTFTHDALTHQATSIALERQLTQAGYDVRLIHSRTEDRTILADRFNLISVVLSILSTLIAVVGAIGLTGTMSMNVLERTREIGVMRAIGASDKAVRQVIVSEGVVIGMLAWVMGVLISLPMSAVMCYGIGINLLGTSLIWTYALYAGGIWFVVVLLLSVIASRLPARTAIKLTVREVLAYE
ncbi:MAG: FtsX-like permease family protein [Chloroflexales bacterium]|nr:FtsX-like permease family protein [Chloroflexales bacterium]